MNFRRQTRMRTALGPPEPLPIIEKKRTTNRRKKLFQQEEDIVDLEPCEVSKFLFLIFKIY